ncbi:MAG TPA: hypothetical protein P5077_05015 [bacterium]|nr:hypothetical protein [bacterium]
MKRYVILAIIVSALMTSCYTPHWLVSNDFKGTDKTFKEFFVPVGSGGMFSEDANIFNYNIRVCTIDDNANLTQCVDTMVIGNVVADSRYGGGTFYAY